MHLSRFHHCHHRSAADGWYGGKQAQLDQFLSSFFSRDSSGSSWLPPIEPVVWATSGGNEVASPFHKHFMVRGDLQEIGPQSSVLSSTLEFRLFMWTRLIFLQTLRTSAGFPPSISAGPYSVQHSTEVTSFTYVVCWQLLVDVGMKSGR